MSYRTLEPALPVTPHMAIYSLQQDPSGGFGLSSRSKFVHTVIKNVGILYAHRAPGYSNGRWLTPSEVLLCQGFAVGPQAPPQLQHTSSFSVERADGRRREQTKGQAGNAMCVPVMGALLLYIVSQVSIVPCGPSNENLGALLLRRRRRA